MNTKSFPKDRPEESGIEAHLCLTEEGVIAGTVSGVDGPPRRFHGWLELMDAIEAIRLGRSQTPV